MQTKGMDQPAPDVYATRLDNFDLLLRFVKKRDIAKKMEGGQNYLSQVHSKKRRKGLKPMGKETARSIERAVRELGLSWVHDGWMDFPHSLIDVGEKTPVSVRRPPSKPVRVITWRQAGGFEGMTTLDGYGDGGGELADAPSSAGVGTFALRVRGDSMENPTGMPSYPAGTTIIVDPTRKPRHGSGVIVKLADAPEAVFKIYEKYDGKTHLKPLNPRYGNVAPMPEGARIVGVVILMLFEPEDRPD